MRDASRLAWGALFVFAGWLSPSAHQPERNPVAATPLEPVGAILDAFHSHQIVALGEGAHGNEQGHAFRLSLVRDPQFSNVVNDIVVEFGNSLYQDVMDRFVRGENVDDRALRHVWQDTTQMQGPWERPIYEEFFREIRRLNARLPETRRLRVLLGDPPVDWTRTDAEGIAGIQKRARERNSYPAQLIQREVVSKHRRALLVWGDGHFQRRPDMLVGELERRAAIRVFSISSNTFSDLGKIQSDVSEWPVPSLVVLRGTAIGAADFNTYFPGPREPQPLHIEDRFDALLHLGPLGGIRMVPYPPSYCDAAALNARLARIALLPELAMMADGQRRMCGTAVR